MLNSVSTVNTKTLVSCCWQDGAEGGVVYAALQAPPAKPPRAAAAVKDDAPETEYGTVISA